MKRSIILFTIMLFTCCIPTKLCAFDPYNPFPRKWANSSYLIEFDEELRYGRIYLQGKNISYGLGRDPYEKEKNLNAGWKCFYIKVPLDEMESLVIGFANIVIEGSNLYWITRDIESEHLLSCDVFPEVMNFSELRQNDLYSGNSATNYSVGSEDIEITLPNISGLFYSEKNKENWVYKLDRYGNIYYQNWWGYAYSDEIREEKKYGTYKIVEKNKKKRIHVRWSNGATITLKLYYRGDKAVIEQHGEWNAVYKYIAE